MPRIDHYGYSVTSRDDLEENIVYCSSGTRRVIRRLREGDVVRLTREGNTYDQVTGEIVGTEHDTAGIEIDGEVYTLFDQWHYKSETSSWLRKDGVSRGKIKRLTIKELNNE